jgi:hypothetical protein
MVANCCDKHEHALLIEKKWKSGKERKYAAASKTRAVRSVAVLQMLFFVSIPLYLRLYCVYNSHFYACTYAQCHPYPWHPDGSIVSIPEYKKHAVPDGQRMWESSIFVIPAPTAFFF